MNVHSKHFLCLLLAQARLLSSDVGIRRRRTTLSIIIKIMKQRKTHERIYGYIDLVQRYLDDDFKSHFRMTRTTMNLLIDKVASRLHQKHRGRYQEAPSLQCLIAVWTLAGQESYRSIADRFNVTKNTVFHYIIRICKVLNELAEDIIKWPDETRVRTILEEFKNKSHFPNVLGAIDGCHIDIKAPVENGAAYVNRKGRLSMILQAVCDHRCMFIDCFMGYPGSTHDARVFKKSGMQQRCSEEQYFPYDSHLLGDSAYPLGKHILVPFKDNGHLTRKQVKYNTYHASARSVIERSFGILKGRWRRLIYFEMHNTKYLPAVIMATCVLHNFCILYDDYLDTDDNYNNEDIANNVDANEMLQCSRDGVNKRNLIVNNL